MADSQKSDIVKRPAALWNSDSQTVKNIEKGDVSHACYFLTSMIRSIHMAFFSSFLPYG